MGEKKHLEATDYAGWCQKKNIYILKDAASMSQVGY